MRVFCSCVGTARHFTKKHKHNLVYRTLKANCVNTLGKLYLHAQLLRDASLKIAVKLWPHVRMSMCVWEPVKFPTWKDLYRYSCQN